MFLRRERFEDNSLKWSLYMKCTVKIRFYALLSRTRCLQGERFLDNSRQHLVLYRRLIWSFMKFQCKHIFYLINNNSMGNEQFHLFKILITPSPILLQNHLYRLKHFLTLYLCTFIHLQRHFGVALVTIVREPSSPHISAQFSSSSCLWERSSADLFLLYLHVRSWWG